MHTGPKIGSGIPRVSPCLLSIATLAGADNHPPAAAIVMAIRQLSHCFSTLATESCDKARLILSTQGPRTTRGPRTSTGIACVYQSSAASPWYDPLHSKATLRHQYNDKACRRTAMGLPLRSLQSIDHEFNTDAFKVIGCKEYLYYWVGHVRILVYDWRRSNSLDQLTERLVKPEPSGAQQTLHHPYGSLPASQTDDRSPFLENVEHCPYSPAQLLPHDIPPHNLVAGRAE